MSLLFWNRQNILWKLLAHCLFVLLLKRAVLQRASLRAMLVVPDAVLHCAELESLTPKSDSVCPTGQLRLSSSGKKI